MLETNDVLGQAGAGEMVESLGSAWSLAHVGPGHRGRFSAWAKLRARTEIQQLRQHLSESTYREDLSAFHASCAAGDYNWGSPFAPESMGDAVQTLLGSEDGQMILIGLLMEARHGQLPPVRLREIVNGNTAGFTDAVLACMHLPNRKAPTESGATQTTMTQQTMPAQVTAVSEMTERTLTV